MVMVFLTAYFLENKYDILADKNGYIQLTKLSGVLVEDEEVYHKEEGFMDSIHLFKFKATQEEIDKIIEANDLSSEISHFMMTPSYYWWDDTQFQSQSPSSYGYQLYEYNKDSEIKQLHYNKETMDAHYIYATL